MLCSWMNDYHQRHRFLASLSVGAYDKFTSSISFQNNMCFLFRGSGHKQNKGCIHTGYRIESHVHFASLFPAAALYIPICLLFLPTEAELLAQCRTDSFLRKPALFLRYHRISFAKRRIHTERHPDRQLETMISLS